MEILENLPWHKFCHYCGAPTNNAVKTPEGWWCPSCKHVRFTSQDVVAVLIAPCGYHESGREHGVFIGKRGKGPGTGGWALPAGYVMQGETWQQAAGREAAEELNIICRVNHSSFENPELVLVENSSTLKQVIVVGSVKGVFHIGAFMPDEETLERDVIFPDDYRQLCFPIHRQALAMHWDSLGVAHNITF